MPPFRGFLVYLPNQYEALTFLAPAVYSVSKAGVLKITEESRTTFYGVGAWTKVEDLAQPDSA